MEFAWPALTGPCGLLYYRVRDEGPVHPVAHAGERMLGQTVGDAAMVGLTGIGTPTLTGSLAVADVLRE